MPSKSDANINIGCALFWIAVFVVGSIATWIKNNTGTALILLGIIVIAIVGVVNKSKQKDAIKDETVSRNPKAIKENTGANKIPPNPQQVPISKRNQALDDLAVNLEALYRDHQEGRLSDDDYKKLRGKLFNQ